MKNYYLISKYNQMLYSLGLTSESILPQQAKCANIDLKDLFINAIEEVIN